MQAQYSMWILQFNLLSTTGPHLAHSPCGGLLFIFLYVDRRVKGQYNFHIITREEMKLQSETMLAVISGLLALGIILLTVRLCHYKKQLQKLYKNNNESAAETIGAKNKITSCTEEIGRLINEAERGCKDNYGLLKTSGDSKAVLKVSGEKEITDKILSILAKASGSIKQMTEIAGEAVRLLSGSEDKIKDASHEALLVNDEYTDMDVYINEFYRTLNAVKIIIIKLRDSINDINTLSFKAAMECQRAGEAGRGFKVAADEIRQAADNGTALLNETDSSIEELSETVRIIDSRIRNLEEKRNTLNKAVESLCDGNNYVADKFSELYENIEITEKVVNHLAANSKEFFSESEEKKKVYSDMAKVFLSVGKAEKNIAADMTKIRSLNEDILNIVGKL